MMPYGRVHFVWDVAYDRADALIGDRLDVELAACWKGEPGAFCKAMADCRLLDEHEGKFYVHDLEDHCPEYVLKRIQRKMHAASQDTVRRTLAAQRKTAANNGGQRTPEDAMRSTTANNGGRCPPDGAMRRTSANNGALTGTGQSSPEPHITAPGAGKIEDWKLEIERARELIQAQRVQSPSKAADASLLLKVLRGLARGLFSEDQVFEAFDSAREKARGRYAAITAFLNTRTSDRGKPLKNVLAAIESPPDVTLAPQFWAAPTVRRANAADRGPVPVGDVLKGRTASNGQAHSVKG